MSSFPVGGVGVTGSEQRVEATRPAIWVAFRHTFAVAPDAAYRVELLPGSDLGQWVTVTRPVLDVSIHVGNLGTGEQHGASLEVQLSAYNPAPPALPVPVFESWRVFGLVEGNVPNVISGLRLPGPFFVRFLIRTGNPVDALLIQGGVMLRGE